MTSFLLWRWWKFVNLKAQFRTEIIQKPSHFVKSYPKSYRIFKFMKIFYTIDKAY